MKTQNFFMLILAVLTLGFTACDKSNTAIDTTTMDEMVTANDMNLNNGLFQEDQNNSVEANFEELALGSDLFLTKSPENPYVLTGGRPITLYRSIRVVGKGTGSSELLGDALVEFDIIIDKQTLDFKGNVTYHFEEESDFFVIDIRGTGPMVTIPQFEGPHTGLIAEVTFAYGKGRFDHAELNAVGYLLNADEILNANPTYNENFNLDGFIAMNLEL